MYAGGQVIARATRIKKSNDDIMQFSPCAPQLDPPMLLPPFFCEGVFQMLTQWGCVTTAILICLLI